MKINKENIKRLVILLIVSGIYPVYKYISTKNFVALCDGFTIEGLVLLVLGLIKVIFDSNSFASTSYIIQKKFFKYNQTYDVYLKDVKTNKGFNYALYIGLVDIIISIIISLFI